MGVCLLNFLCSGHLVVVICVSRAECTNTYVQRERKEEEEGKPQMKRRLQKVDQIIPTTLQFPNDRRYICTASFSLWPDVSKHVRGKTKSRRIFKKPSLNHGKNISWHSPEALEGNFRTKLLFSLFPKKERKKREEFRHLLFLLSSINHENGRRWQIYPSHLPHPPPPVPILGYRVAKNKDQSSLVTKYLSCFWSTLYCRCSKQEVERRKAGT